LSEEHGGRVDTERKHEQCPQYFRLQRENRCLAGTDAEAVRVCCVKHSSSVGEEMLPHVAAHLEYTNGLEAKGLLFASGPFIEPGVLVGDGLTILQTETIEEARFLMDAELDLPVADETGLKGNDDVNLAVPVDSQTDSDAAIITALQDQLGLKLKSGKFSADIISKAVCPYILCSNRCSVGH
jgi:uncharacterized protein YciI